MGSGDERTGSEKMSGRRIERRNDMLTTEAVDNKQQGEGTEGVMRFREV